MCRRTAAAWLAVGLLVPLGRAAAEPLPAGAVVRLGSPGFAHRGSVNAIAWTPDGTRLVSATLSSVHVWDAATGRAVRDIRHVDGPRDVAVSPDGKSVAAACPAAGVLLFDAERGRRRGPAVGTKCYPWCVAFSPDGCTLAFAGRDDHLHLWDVTNGEERRAWPIPIDAKSLAFSADSKAVTLTVANLSAATCLRWDAATGEAAGRWPDLRLPVAFSPDGTRLAAATADSRFALRDAVTNRDRWSAGLPPPKPADNVIVGEAVAFSPDGTRVACADAAQRVHVWDAATGRELWQVGPFPLAVGAVAFSPDGKRLAVAASHRLRVFDAATGRDIHPDAGHGSAVYRAAFGSDGSILTESHGIAVEWDGGTGRVSRPATDRGSAFAALPNGNRLVSKVTSLVEREAGTGREVRMYPVPERSYLTAPPRGVAVAAGDRFVIGSKSRTVRLYSTATGREAWAATRDKADDGIVDECQHQPIAFTPNAAAVVTLADDGIVRFLDAATGKEVRRVATDATDGVLSPDGRYLVATDKYEAGPYGRKAKPWLLRLFDLTTPGEPRDLTPWRATLPTFSPDGRLVAAAWGADVALIDRATGREARRFEGHRGDVVCLMFSPDGRRLVSGSRDLTAVVWDVPMTNDQ